MKRYFLFILTALLCLSASTASANPVVVKAHKTTHKIVMPSLMGLGGSCSATAIGPHALLTAGHCLEISAVLTVDDKDANVVAIEGDGIDHMIYFLSGVEFKDYADVELNAKPTQGDGVFLFGNPGHFEDMYRTGVVSGFNVPEKEDDDEINPLSFLFGKTKKHKANGEVRLTYYDFNGFFGDSGSGIFNEQGKVIAVTTLIDGQANGGYSLKFMGSYEFHFTPEQLKRARDFVPLATCATDDEPSTPKFQFKHKH